MRRDAHHYANKLQRSQLLPGNTGGPFQNPAIEKSSPRMYVGITGHNAVGMIDPEQLAGVEHSIPAAAFVETTRQLLEKEGYAGMATDDITTTEREPMECYICTQCGTQYAGTEGPPETCCICTDE